MTKCFIYVGDIYYQIEKITLILIFLSKSSVLCFSHCLQLHVNIKTIATDELNKIEADCHSNYLPLSTVRQNSLYNLDRGVDSDTVIFGVKQISNLISKKNMNFFEQCLFCVSKIFKQVLDYIFLYMLISNSLSQNLSHVNVPDGLVTELDEKTSASALKTVERKEFDGLSDE